MLKLKLELWSSMTNHMTTIKIVVEVDINSIIVSMNIMIIIAEVGEVAIITTTMIEIINKIKIMEVALIMIEETIINNKMIPEIQTITSMIEEINNTLHTQNTEEVIKAKVAVVIAKIIK